MVRLPSGSTFTSSMSPTTSAKWVTPSRASLPDPRAVPMKPRHSALSPLLVRTSLKNASFTVDGRAVPRHILELARTPPDALTERIAGARDTNNPSAMTELAYQFSQVQEPLSSSIAADHTVYAGELLRTGPRLRRPANRGRGQRRPPGRGSGGGGAPLSVEAWRRERHIASGWGVRR